MQKWQKSTEIQFIQTTCIYFTHVEIQAVKFGVSILLHAIHLISSKIYVLKIMYIFYVCVMLILGCRPTRRPEATQGQKRQTPDRVTQTTNTRDNQMGEASTIP